MAHRPQRLHQFEGGHTDNYGGTKINIDGDYLDSATAAAGSGSSPVISTAATVPSISVAPQADGAVELAPEWPDATGVSSYEILAGSTADTLTEVRTVYATRTAPVVMHDVYPYFQVQALDATGEVIGSSAATPTPSRPAIFGQSALCPHDRPGWRARVLPQRTLLPGQADHPRRHAGDRPHLDRLATGRPAESSTSA